MRKIRLLCLLALALPVAVFAQREFTSVHDGCMPDNTDTATGHRAGLRKLPAIKTDWDPQREYRQMVILVEFADTVFSYASDVHEFYDNIFNKQGYNDDKGPGCVADYFRDQSQGMLNLKFDVFGPVKVSTKAQPIEEPTDKTRNYGKDAFIEATNKVIAANPDLDFSVYDWNGDKTIEQVIFVYAGLPGNLGESTYGYIWPNTSSFTTITTSSGYRITNYTASGELWPTKKLRSCGIGTICHEFTHSLGLPDIYPTSSNAGYSVCDEWDLMDGGNFTNYGWCPPNYTPIERWLMGWISFTDLEEPATITGMKPVSEGGEVYRIKHSEKEWLLLENRQQRGWDAGAPGKGLVVYHVYYDEAAWRSNTLNNNSRKRRFELVHADNMDYDAWYSYYLANGLSNYLNSSRMNSRVLSSSPYPWTTDSTTFVNSELTETSVPAPRMNEPNENGDSLLGKPITHIQMTEEGLISFDFMGGDDTGIEQMKSLTSNLQPQIYDLQGRSISGIPGRGRGVYIQRRADGTIRKCFNKLYIY